MCGRPGLEALPSNCEALAPLATPRTGGPSPLTARLSLPSPHQRGPSPLTARLSPLATPELEARPLSLRGSLSPRHTRAGGPSPLTARLFPLAILQPAFGVINPRRACAARVTAVGSVCVCVCVCLLLYISPLERLFVPETIPSTQRAMKVRKFVGVSLKMLRCKARALPALYG